MRINKNSSILLLILLLAILSSPTFSQQQTSPSYQTDKQIEEISQLNSSIESLLQALTNVAQQEGQQSLSKKVSSEVLLLTNQSELLVTQGKLQEARQPLNRALVKIKIAINAIKGTPPQDPPKKTIEQQADEESASEFVLNKRKDDIDKQKSTIDALMQALIRIGEDKQQQQMVKQVAEQVSKWSQQSDKLVEQKKLIQARQFLDQSLVEIKTAIGALRENETLVRSLNFSTKKEEYAYELDRFNTYQMLLQMLVLPKPDLTSIQREQIQLWSREAKVQLEMAKLQAQNGQYKQAVDTLEAAAQILLKAIRRGGVYLPG
ncbi:hypothetical protein A9Q98_10455 [Thalassotalea sp. 42_200_T64]|nr:hypothetical protein A9Q98_10455 [Thalassotalea sp. 42_200_T64]